MQNYEGTVLFCFLPTNAVSDDISAEDRVALQTVINDVRVFADEDQCVDALTSIVDETIFLYLGAGRSCLLDVFVYFRQLEYIYLSETQNHPSLSKIRGVFPTRNQFVDQLKKDVKIAVNNYSHLCLTIGGDLNRTYASLQNVEKESIKFKDLRILRRLLLKISKPPENVYKDLLDECRLIYRNNAAQNRVIDEFEREYTPDKAIWWYTRDSFVFKVYRSMKNYDRAHSHLIQCLSIQKRQTNPDKNTLISVYKDLFYLEDALGNYQKRDYFLQQVLDICSGDTGWASLTNSMINYTLSKRDSSKSSTD